MLQLNAKLKALIDKLWDRFWSGGISNPLSAIEQITYLLFMKQIDELDLKREKDAEFTGDTYMSRFTGFYFLPQDRDKANKLDIPEKGETGYERKSREKERQSLAIDKATLRWSYFKEMKAELMLPHVQQKVFPFIKDLNGDGSAFTKHMANAVFIIPSANLLQGSIQIIEDIFTEIERDAKEEGHLFQDIQGDVYEMLLNEISSAGKNGQFRTPRHIIKLVSELVNPQLGHRICDPACGTAGFLLDAYQYIVTQLAIAKAKKGQVFSPDDDGFVRTSVSGLLTEKNKNILEQSLYGFDFDSTISLPSGVFKPYAGVATAILVFTRGGKTQNTWFYRLENDGLSLDDKRQRIPGSQLPDVVGKWKTRDPKKPSDRKDSFFFVPIQEIQNKGYDLSFNRYSEVVDDITVYEKPKVILQKLKTLEGKIQQGIKDLEEVLG